MENIDFNNILNRNIIAKQIEEGLNKINSTKNINKNIFISGNNGIGKTKFVLNLLKDLDYDVVYYDNTTLRNKQLMENLSSNNLGNNNVYNLLRQKQKKIVIVLDDIYTMTNGDKSGLINLIKLIRVKKTKKQQLENSSNNPIICINNKISDKKILELIKISHAFELNSPTNDELLKLLKELIPKLFCYKKEINNTIKLNILDYLNNNLYKLEKLVFYKNNDLILDKFFYNYKNSNNNNLTNIKEITQNMISNYNDFGKINNILETDRTIVSLLYHENIIQLFNNNHDNIHLYLKILDNFIFSDYIDRIIFQKQIWQLTEINYIIKLFYNNFLLHQHNKLQYIPLDNIIFTKILTKYSGEYNNNTFIYYLIQNFLLKKEDILLLFYDNRILEEKINMDYVNELLEKFSFYNLSKLEVIRMIKFIKQLINYNYIENEKILDSNKEVLDDDVFCEL
tara:strand:- start:830 stop:2191 length:1362 start_codon:yes stop_codon:yes gene_type:complete